MHSLNDFIMVQTLSPTNSLGYFGAAECYSALANNLKAVECYTEALELDSKLNDKILLKRCQLFINNKEYDLALSDVSAYLETVDSSNVDAILIKGLIQQKKGIFSDAIINYEQVIKNTKDENMALKAIIRIAKIKLKQKDFYGAHHTLQRPAILNINRGESKKLENYINFNEAVLYLIKRKPKIAIKILTNLLKNDKLSKYIKAHSHIYRGYGNMVLHNFEVNFN